MFRNICLFLICVIVILLYGCSENKPPKIKLLQVLAGDIYPFDSIKVVATVIDPENGRLRYKWSTNGGVLSESNEPSVIWYAPEQAGQYKVWLRVNDVLGAKDQKSIKIKVLSESSSDTIKMYEPTKRTRVLRPPRRPGGRQTK